MKIDLKPAEVWAEELGTVEVFRGGQYRLDYLVEPEIIDEIQKNAISFAQSTQRKKLVSLLRTK